MNFHGRRGVVVTVIEVKSLIRLGIGFDAPVHPHHACIEKRYYLQVRHSPKDNLVCLQLRSVELDRGAGKTIRSPQDNLERQMVAICANERGFDEVDAREQ